MYVCSLSVIHLTYKYILIQHDYKKTPADNNVKIKSAYNMFFTDIKSVCMTFLHSNNN